MTKTIEDLWNGNLAPADNCGNRDPELNHLIALMERNRAKLCESINALQQETFEKYIDSSEEYLLRMMERAFCDGFCLASKLLMEALSEA